MPKPYDEPIALPGIKPREHSVATRHDGKVVRGGYPFRAMLVGDYFRIRTPEGAQKARDALKTFYRNRQSVGRRFTVRPNTEGIWICRRYR